MREGGQSVPAHEVARPKQESSPERTPRDIGVLMPDNPRSLAGITTKHSSMNVAQTVDRLKGAIADRGFTLVWEDGNGAVSVSYNSPEFLVARHHVDAARRAPFDAVESIVEAVVSP